MTTTRTRLTRLEQHITPPRRGRVIKVRGGGAKGNVELSEFLRGEGLGLKPNDVVLFRSFWRPGVTGPIPTEHRLELAK